MDPHRNPYQLCEIPTFVEVLAKLIVPGRCQPSIVSANELNFCVRDGNRWTLIAIHTNYAKYPLSWKCWQNLLSRAVASQVSSARTSLTSVFGMGTGGPSSQSIPTSISFSCLSRDSFDIISHSLKNVNTYFYNFQNFFLPCKT